MEVKKTYPVARITRKIFDEVRKQTVITHNEKCFKKHHT